MHVCVVLHTVCYNSIADEVNEAGQTTKSTNCQAIVSINMEKWKVRIVVTIIIVLSVSFFTGMD